MDTTFLRPYFFATFLALAPLYLVLGSVEEIFISDLTGGLRSFQGDIHSERIHLGLNSTRLDFYDFHGIVYEENDQLTLSQKNTTLVLESFKSSSFNFLEDIDIQNADFRWRKNRDIFLAIRSANVKLGDGLQQFENFKLNCQALSEQHDNHDFLLPCLERGRFSIPLINLDQLMQAQLTETLMTKELESFLLMTGHKMSDISPEFITPRRIRDVSMSTNRGVFNLRAKARVIFNLTVRVDGDINYHKSSQTLTIDIERANVGIIPIKRSLLNTLKNNGFEVRGDRVTIKL